MVEKIYNLTQEEANVVIEKCLSSKKYRIIEQSSKKVVLKEKTIGDLLTHLVILGITFWSYGIFNLIYAIASGEQATINIKKPSSGVKSNDKEEQFAEITLGNSSSSDYYGFNYIRHSDVDDKSIVWIEKDQSIEVAGLNINDGMFYISQKSSSIPCVISKNMTVANQHVSPALRNMGYWPSYNHITPDARKAYLIWLAGGRKDPNADIGYVFLFFYGLEYRFFKEIKKNGKLKDEAIQIEDEIQRLLGIYSHSGSFNGYASNFLNFIRLWRNGTDDDTFKFQTSSDGVISEVIIGKLIFDKRPIPSDAVYALMLGYCYLNTPGNRCRDEMKVVFANLYNKKYGDGLVISPKSMTRTITYYPASLGISGDTSITLKGISDFSIKDLPTRSLHAMMKKSETLLDSYSRFIGKDKNVTVESKLYLPQELRSLEFTDGIDKVKEKIGIELVTMLLSDLLSVFGLNANISVKSLALFVKMLSDESIVLIPSKPIDRKIDFNMKVTLLLSKKKFNINEEEVAYPRIIVYAISYILAGITTVSDNDINNIVCVLTKSVNNRIYLKTIFGQNVKLVELRAYIQKIDRYKKEAFLKDVVSKVSNITDITTNVIKKIEKIGVMLSIDVKDLHTIIHNAHTKSESKVSNKLDFEKISKLKKTSKEISEILDKVFTDEEVDTSKIKTKKAVKGTTCVLNLVGKKEDFFNILIAKDVWDRDDLNKIAKDKGLMLDGILEEINEQAFDVFDDTFIEQDDKIYVNLELLEA